uniref:Uncharacterized protein n=1 Tax=Davidia involucrata TaxID=16924 RepID=A0A5B7B210_DAVIN
MREENLSENKSKFSDQNQMPKGSNVKNPSKLRSSWRSNIVKGFSAEKKTKLQTTKKVQPLTSSDISNQNDPFVPSHSRVMRSLIGDLSCSVNATQGHVHRTKSSGSRDLFLELDHLRSLLQESKESKLSCQN